MPIIVKILFILIFGAIWLMSAIMLKPTRKHKKFKISTIFLKISYIIYLLLLFTTIHVTIFYHKDFWTDFLDQESSKMSIIYITLLLSISAPTFFITIRKKIHNRTPFNIIIGSLCICFDFVFIYLIYNQLAY
jgi:hypothetical protein